MNKKLLVDEHLNGVNTPLVNNAVNGMNILIHTVHYATVKFLFYNILAMADLTIV